MKKNIFKKVVASLATVAMAVSAFASMPAENVKADSKKTEIVLILSGETSSDKILFDIDGQDSGITASGTVDTSLGWGRDMYTFTQDSNDKTRYTITVDGTIGDAGYCNMQFVFASGSTLDKGYKYYPQDDRDTFLNNDTLYIQIDLSKESWSVFTASAEDPNAAKPSDIMAVIDAIGTVELTEDCLKKIEAAETAYNTFTGDKSAVTNYATLTAARAKYDQLVAAENAKNAGTLTVYVKSPGWTEMNVYGWDGAEFGEWPGKTLTALKQNDGWFSVSFEINKATNLIFNNNDAGEQTVDWTNVSAGTYWLVLSEKDDSGKYTVENVSTKAPSDWKDEAAEKVENPTTTTQSNTTTNNGTSGNNTTPATADVAPVMAMAVLAVAAGALVVASRKRAVNE